MSHRIVTHFWMKPIPLRQFDWIAYYDDDEPSDGGGMDMGEGATEAQAVVDLIENHPRGYPDCERDCTCRLESVNSASIDPPEPILDPWCPAHGKDPDTEYERQRDDVMTARWDRDFGEEL